MGKIDFQKLEEIALELSEESKKTKAMQTGLEHILEEGRQIKTRIPNAVSQDRTAREEGHSADAAVLSAEKHIQSAAEILDTESHALGQAAETLKNILILYRHAQQRVLDIYSGEIRVVPRTEFGTSHFENLHSYASLIPVFKAGPAGAEDENRDGKERGRQTDQTDIQTLTLPPGSDLGGIL